MFKKIAVCLDGSSLAEQILPYVKDVASQFHSKIILLQVVPTPRSLSKPEMEPISATEIVERMQNEIQTKEAEAKIYLEQVAHLLEQNELDVEYVILHGVPGTSIVNYAHENNIALIALSTHGRSGLGRLVFGSVADHVLRESGLPILLIKPKNPGV